MFRLVSLNLNGIRSAANKGFIEWAAAAGADCMGVQELKVHVDDMPEPLKAFAGMNGHFHHAEKKGYSGVGLYTRKEPSHVIVGFDRKEFDAEHAATLGNAPVMTPGAVHAREGDGRRAPCR